MSARIGEVAEYKIIFGAEYLDKQKESTKHQKMYANPRIRFAPDPPRYMTHCMTSSSTNEWNRINSSMQLTHGATKRTNHKEFTKTKRNYGYQRQRAQCSRQSSMRHDAAKPDDDELHAGRDPSAGTESRGEFDASVVTP